MDDAFNLARSGRLDYQYPLGLASYLSRETDYFPLYSFFQALTFLDVALAASEEYATLKVVSYCVPYSYKYQYLPLGVRCGPLRSIL